MPFYATLSVGMGALSLISIVASFLRPMTALGMVLLSLFGPTTLGVVFAAVGIRNKEQPKKFPIVALVFNVAIPLGFFALAAVVAAGLGSWHD